MKWMWAAVAILAALCLQPAGVFGAGDTEETLVRQIRAVARQYDNIADRGDSKAPDLAQVRDRYLSILRQAAESGSPGQTMREMAEVFVLSGGESGILEHWKVGLDSKSAEQKILDGTIAYAEGRTLDAEAKLLGLDATSMSPWRGGHLALAQALLTARNNPKRAFGYLKIAARLLPGTLVEEAALRQTATLAARTSDPAEFTSAVTTYFFRFPNSANLADFEAKVAFQIVCFDGSDGVRILGEILSALPEGWGQCLTCFLTAIAERAVLMGKVELASTAAAAALPLVSNGSRERQRLSLYSGAAAIVTDRYQDGVTLLHSVQEAKLGDDDRKLLAASLAVAGKLRKTPVRFTQLERNASPGPVKGNRVFPPSVQEEAARRALADADAILKNAK